MSLWDEIIEVSTYGPSERKMLKVQRERQKELSEKMDEAKTSEAAINRNDSLRQTFDFEEEGDKVWMKHSLQQRARVKMTTTD